MRFYGLVDKWGRIVYVLKAKSIEQARKRVKKVTKEDIKKIKNLNELIIGD